MENKWIKRGILALIVVMFFLVMAYIGMPADGKKSVFTKPNITLFSKNKEEADSKENMLSKPSDIDKKKAITVHFIDVGQGKSILLEKNGKGILIDGGEETNGEFLLAYLRQAHIEELEYVIATHPHSDHIGGLIQVLETLKVHEVIMPEAIHTTATFETFLSVLLEKDILVTVPTVGDKFGFEDSLLTCLSPVKEYPSLNNMSLAMRLEYKNISFLFTGDIEKEAEMSMIEGAEEEVIQLQSTILDAPHHGSDTSNSVEFITHVAPKIVVFSVGKDNTYNHPHKEVLDRYTENGTWILRTDEEGSIVFETDGKNIARVSK